MKRSDIEQGVVYALRRGKYYSAEAVVFLTGPNGDRYFTRPRSASMGDPYLTPSAGSHRSLGIGYPVVRLADGVKFSARHGHTTPEVISAALLAITPERAFKSIRRVFYVVLNRKRDVCAILNYQKEADARVDSVLARADECEWVGVELDVQCTLGQIVGVYSEVLAAEKAKRLADEQLRQEVEQARNERENRAGELVQQFHRLGFPSAHAAVSSRFGTVRIDLDEQDASYLVRCLLPAHSTAGMCVSCKRATFRVQDGTAIIVHRENCPGRVGDGYHLAKTQPR